MHREDSQPTDQPALLPRGLRQFFRFVLVGILNTAFGYGVFALTYLATGSQTISIIVANIVGMAFNYFSIGRLVFARTSGVAWRFCATYLLILLANLGLAEALRPFQIEGLICQLLILPILVVLSYALNATFVFKRNRSQPPTPS